jgi:BASS family bile acid:Na+ symporter
VALVIVTSRFAETPAVTAVVAYTLISTVGALGFALLSSRFDAAGASNALAGRSD